ncbi:MAG: ABC transporter ATP-binding protein [Planctomycetota bacterium]|nr:ABC transporter ATP-binding protein [Planctomycetota bacterium]
MAVVTLKHITKIFGQGPTVVDDFSLDVADGELVVLFGPSGCGKTTTLRMVAGLESVTSGSIFIGNRCVESAGDVPRINIQPARRNVAMVFQNQALYPHLDVFANMAFGLKMRGTAQPEIQRRVSEIAELLGLGPLVHRRPSQLSGGQRQRVALGRALVRRADVYLMDEPLSSLDGPLRDNLRREIRQLHERLGTTMLWVTHQAEEAMALADRVVVMRQAGTHAKTPGGIQQIDNPATIYESPSNRFVAAMVGRPGINVMSGTLDSNGSRLDFNGETLNIPGIDSIHPKLKNHAGRAVDVGARPEDVTIVPANQNVPPRNCVIEGKVDSIERFGRECLLYVGGIDGTTFETGFDADDENMDLPERWENRNAFVVRPRTDQSMLSAKGEKVMLAVDPRRLLFFSYESGRTIF